MKSWGEKLGILLLLVMIFLSGGMLFFEDQVSALTSVFGLQKHTRSMDQSGKVLKIAYLFAPKDLNPFSEDPATQVRLHDVYQGLVQMDSDLIVRPALAVSYGQISDREWLIRLRDGVKFHDQTTLDSEDVFESLKTAQILPSSSVSELMASIESFSKVDEKVLKIITKKPDPLFLNKLSRLPILPSGYIDYSQPDGTGPYQLEMGTDLADLKYQRFDGYWGEKPFFGQVEIKAINDKNERIDALNKGQIDFLADVPPDSVDELKQDGFMVDSIPSLEIGFVMFNFKDPLFADLNVRKAFAEAINKESFLDLAMGHAKTVNQFVSNGVFGYNPDLVGIAFDPKDAAEEISKNVSGFEKLKVQLTYPDNLKLLGQYFQEQLAPAGVELSLNPLSDQQLQEQVSEAALPFYYLGWRSDTGDALPFLKAAIHTQDGSGSGSYNGMHYSNAKVDQLIEKSETNLNLKERLKDMQDVMKTITEDDVVGIPLFESQSLFAYRNDLLFKARVDSGIYPSDIKNK